MASANTVAVVVPSPATSLVLLATSRTMRAPMCSYLSSSSISRATVTPSLVTVGEPNDFWMMTFRPRGPSVTLTARASLVTPRCIAWRASWSNAIIFAAMCALAPGNGWGFRSGGYRRLRAGPASVDHGEDVVLAHQEDLLVAVDLELVPGVGGEQD